MTTEQAREFTEAVVARHFGRKSDSGAAHELGKDKAKYERMKIQAIKDKLIVDIAVSQPWMDRNYRDRFKEAPLTPEQIRIRALVSLEEVDSYYVRQSTGDQNNLSKLAADTTPEGRLKFQQIQEAAQEYGYVVKRQAPREPEPKPVQRETMLTLSPEQCQRIGLKPGTQVDEHQYLRIVTTIHEVDEQLAKAAAQRAKDDAVDESLKSVGSIRETTGADAAIVARGLQTKP